MNAGSLSDVINLANASLYGFEDYHGVDIGVMKAVRLWYTACSGEYAIEINLQEGDVKLGFTVGRTEEGFIYIVSVCGEDDGGSNSTVGYDGDGGNDVDRDIEIELLPSSRSGLRQLFREAKRDSKLLVISRISNEKVLPWIVSPTGGIRCFDTVSISKKLSLHRHALRPILLHLLMPSPSAIEGSLWKEERKNIDGEVIRRDVVGEMSFKFD